VRYVGISRRLVRLLPVPTREQRLDIRLRLGLTIGRQRAVEQQELLELVARRD